MCCQLSPQALARAKVDRTLDEWVMAASQQAPLKRALALGGKLDALPLAEQPMSKSPLPCFLAADRKARLLEQGPGAVAATPQVCARNARLSIPQHLSSCVYAIVAESSLAQPAATGSACLGSPLHMMANVAAHPLLALRLLLATLASTQLPLRMRHPRPAMGTMQSGCVAAGRRASCC